MRFHPGARRKLGPKEVVEESLQILDQIVKEYSNEACALALGSLRPRTLPPTLMTAA